MGNELPVVYEPRVAALITKLEADAPGRFEDHFFELVEGGDNLTAIARRYEVPVTTIQAWLNTDRQRLRGRLREARKAAAEIEAEKGQEILDELVQLREREVVTKDGDIVKVLQPASSAEVQAATSRANFRKWLAGVYDRETYGERPTQVNVGVSFGSAFLDALRAEGHKREVGEVIEAEVVSEDA